MISRYVLVSVVLFIGGLTVLYVARETETRPTPRYPSEWAWTQRTFPFGTADADAHTQALRQAQLKRKESRMQIGSAAWQLAGPTNVTGRISDIEFDPHDSNTVFAGAATGGVFKSTNLGQTWFPIFDEQAVLPIGDIGMDPVNPGVLYVGTGEANGGHNNFAGGGVYKSTNSGVSWTLIGLEQTVSIGRIVVDPLNPQRVFVAAVGSYFSPNPERGIYRSTDGGSTWENVLFVTDSTGGIDIVMDPANPSFLLAAMWERVRRPDYSHLYGPTGGIYRSTNSGDSWEELTGGLPDGSATNVGRIGLALSRSNPQIAYAVYNDGASYLGIFKTTNAGTAWFNADPDAEAAGGFFGFSWYFGQIRIHPANPNDVWVLDGEIMHSTNGGETWGIDLPFHVDFHALAYHPRNASIIFNGNDGGIDRSFNGGSSWEEVAELPITQFYEIGIDYLNPQRLYGGTQDNGTVRTLTGSFTDWVDIWGGDGFYVNIDPTNSNIIYAESQYGFLGKTTDGGNSWIIAMDGIDSGEPTNWSTPVVMDPSDPEVLYYGTNRVYRTVNGALNWTAISGNLTGGTSPRLNTISTIAAAPTDPAVIYAGTADGRVWVTDNSGGNWINISAGLPYRWVTRVAVDPVDPAIAYAAFSGLKWHDPQPHIFRTTDMGTSWQDISGNLPDAPINGLVIDPNHPSVLFVGTDVGAYMTLNLGQTWEVIGAGLPLVSVYDLKIHDTENFLVAGTHGRSMYKIDLAGIVDVAPDPARLPQQMVLHQNYPNPFNPATTISYRLTGAADVELKVFNAIGQEVAILERGVRTAGTHSVTWDGTNKARTVVASGVYFYRLRAGNFVRTKRMLFVK